MPNDRLIYDLGAHRGEDTEFYLKKGFSVVAVEANVELCTLLEQKFSAQVRDGQLKILNIAVSQTAGALDFYVNEDVSVWGTTNPAWVQRNRVLGAPRTRKVTVQARPLLDIFKEYGVPHYCKIDIEGNDLDAIKSLIGSADCPTYISIESEKRDWSRLIDEFLTFRALGYSRYKLIDQTLVTLQSCQTPAREGKFCDHTFESGSSGLFGDELPGSWLALPEAVEAYRQIFLGYALNGDNGLFAKRGRISGLFFNLAHLQGKAARFKGQAGYLNPAEILPPVSWYDTHAAR